ncbi:MAG TPA: secondary thiamine-phosphate synthase [Gammaproteobacteria bacterium]|jgi:secondary thiamine-phosphate synthase enzyme|nr:YjbQ family protein [Pseudomonadota bacterium]HAY47088.1 secondary thiamine-phosphate synthase [Gammaproteobacteria bacterium]
MWHQQQIHFETGGRETIDITAKVSSIVRESAVQTGLVHVFMQHTSASIMLCENADATVRDDLETLIGRIAPDADPEYRHDYEGDDDMAAHGRSVFTSNDISLPISAGELALGTWQGLYLWEHRYQPHHRNLMVTIQGEGFG